MNYANMIEEKNLKKTFILATLVSTIIGTFTTGITLYDRVGDKRKQNKKDSGQDTRIKELEAKIAEKDKGGQHPPRREEELRGSLEYGGPVIRKEFNQDMGRLGPRFAEGDPITHNQVQSQIITLQGTVIHLLEDALYTGKLDNVSKLYNASEFAREGTINALGQQYQRMLQAAPIQRPVGPIRRISSTPSVRPTPKSVKPRPERVEEAHSVRGAPSVRAAPAPAQSVRGAPALSIRGAPAPSVKATPSHKAATEIFVEEDEKVIANSEIKETAALMAFDSTGPLFCRYGVDLQDTNMPLEPCFSRGGSQACPLCGTRLGIEPGRVWKIEKEVVHERISTPKYDDEVIEQRTFLLGNRFIVKCHREKAGFSCILCYKNRDRDTICESVSGLIRHIWQTHEVAEYEGDEDIREASMTEQRISKAY